MSENNDVPDIPQANTVPYKRTRFSVVWIIPIIAALVGIGIAVQRFLNEGPTITITFKVAEGIEAGKTFVKYKDVNIGQVTAVNLSEDYSHVVVKAKIAKSARNLLVKDTKFWIIQPRISLSGVTGIGTLISGNYIGLEAGKSTENEKSFNGYDTPPVITNTEPGRHFLLKADSLWSLGFGSPVYYRRLNVGQVIGYDLAKDGKSFDIKIFVNAPYDKYVTTSTRFWNASGVDLSMGANGLVLRTQSLLSVFAGGIAFEAPPYAQVSGPAAENSVFTLYENQEAATAKHYTKDDPFILVFDESIRGLSVGAPLIYLGIEVGEVKKIGIHYDPDSYTFKPYALVSYYEERLFSQLDNAAAAERDHNTKYKADEKGTQVLIDRGLRAQLRVGNIVTGQLYIALDYFPHAPKVKIDWKKTPPQLPVMPSGMAELQLKITKILNKIDKIPFDEIGTDAKKTIATLDQTLKEANKLLGAINTEVVPEMKTTMRDLKRSINAAERVLANVDKTMIGPDAPVSQELREALREVSRAARSFHTLTEYLETHPEALIGGKAQEKKK
ncbi:MAG: Intermembrane transport protein PqiB [Syntrophus sp. SKADARSKE-3]|nr:Intermembrane transport protein PqiB [Syntrophus sp. SKADARSKE-3]